MQRPWLFIWFVSVISISFGGCRTMLDAKDGKKTTTVSGTVVNLTKGPNRSFRYYGDFLFQSPNRYKGKKVGLFVISHELDARKYSGGTVTFNCNDDDLTRSVEPAPDPFSFSQPEPNIALELTGSAFHPINYLDYENTVSIIGVVRGYDPAARDGGLFFQSDVGYSGDMALVEVTRPANYQGLIIHILVLEQPTRNSETKINWKKPGTKIALSIPESTLAWEPWGFTPLEQLGSVSSAFNSNP